jgi:hypothetical protein
VRLRGTFWGERKYHRETGNDLKKGRWGRELGNDIAGRHVQDCAERVEKC